MPYVGVPAYLLFGGRKLRRRADKKTPFDVPAHGAGSPSRRLAMLGPRVLAAFEMPPPRPGIQVEFITDGGVAFTRLLEMIDAAQCRIEIETFIFSDDSTGRVIAEHLQARAQAGVEVLVLVDALGSFLARWRLLGQLRRHGGAGWCLYAHDAISAPLVGQTCATIASLRCSTGTPQLSVA